MGNKNSGQIRARSGRQITSTKEVISCQRPQLGDQLRLAEGRHASETYRTQQHTTTHHTTPHHTRIKSHTTISWSTECRLTRPIPHNHYSQSPSWLQCGHSVVAGKLKCAVHVITCTGTQNDSVLWRLGGGSGLTLCKAPVVTICTTSLTFNNFTFCPHSVFMCFVWISEQTAIISL